MWETGRGCEDETAMNLNEISCRMGVDRPGTGTRLVADLVLAVVKLRFLLPEY